MSTTLKDDLSYIIASSTNFPVTIHISNAYATFFYGPPCKVMQYEFKVQREIFNAILYEVVYELRYRLNIVSPFLYKIET